MGSPTTTSPGVIMIRAAISFIAVLIGVLVFLRQSPEGGVKSLKEGALPLSSPTFAPVEIPPPPRYIEPLWAVNYKTKGSTPTVYYRGGRGGDADNNAPPSSIGYEARPHECSDNVVCLAHRGCVADTQSICYKAPYDLLGGFSYNSSVPGSEDSSPRTLGGVEQLSEVKIEEKSQEGRGVSPKILKPRTKAFGGTRPGDELICRWMPEDPDRFPTLDLNDTTRRGVVQNFKHITGSFNWKWFDWDAPIRSVPKGTRFKMSGGHRGKDMVYHYSNFCMKIGGRFGGYFGKPAAAPPPPLQNSSSNSSSSATPRLSKKRRPELDPYIGGDDIVFPFPDYYKNYQLPHLQQWISGGEGGDGVEAYDEEPTWFIDRPIAFLQLFNTLSKTHDAHALTRIGAMISAIDSAFPRKTGNSDSENSDINDEDSVARDDVVLSYHFLPAAGDSTDPPGFGYRNTPYWRTSSLATKSTFSSFGSLESARSAYAATNPERYYKFSDEEHKLFIQFLSTPICFKEAIFYQSCFDADCQASNVSGVGEQDKQRTEQQQNDQEEGDHFFEKRRNTWSLWGYRNPATNKKIARRFRSCAGVSHLENSRRPRGAPRLIFSYRQFTKAILHSQSYIPRIREWLDEFIPSAELSVVEFNHLSTPELIALYSQADIVFGPYSTGFMYAFLAPPNSVGLEIAWAGIGIGDSPFVQQGLERSVNNDYGSTFRAVGGWHMGVQLSTYNGRTPGSEIALPLRLMKKTFVDAVKLWVDRNSDEVRRGPTTARPEDRYSEAVLSTLRAKYETTPEEVASFEDVAATDAGGTRLKNLIRAGLSDHLVPLAPGLVELYHRSSSLAHKFHELRWPPPLSLPKRLLLVVECSCHPLFQHALTQELHILRRYLARTTQLLLTIWVPGGGSSCPGVDQVSLQAALHHTYNPKVDNGGFFQCSSEQGPLLQGSSKALEASPLWNHHGGGGLPKQQTQPISVWGVCQGPIDLALVHLSPTQYTKFNGRRDREDRSKVVVGKLTIATTKVLNLNQWAPVNSTCPF